MLVTLYMFAGQQQKFGRKIVSEKKQLGLGIIDKQKKNIPFLVDHVVVIIKFVSSH